MSSYGRNNIFEIDPTFKVLQKNIEKRHAKKIMPTVKIC